MKWNGFIYSLAQSSKNYSFLSTVLYQYYYFIEKMRHTLISPWDKQKYLEISSFESSSFLWLVPESLVLISSQHVISKSILIHDVHCPKSLRIEGRQSARVSL